MFQKLLIFSCHVLAVQRERPQDPTIFGLEIMFHIQRGHLASHHGVPCRGIQMIVEKEHFFSAMFTDDMWNLIVIIYEGIVNLPGIKILAFCKSGDIFILLKIAEQYQEGAQDLIKSIER
ncbi:hypothetical protein pdam_00020704, partial [Pocillopora damicornis]